MAVDPTSPVLPAKVRALLVPIGPMKKSKFSGFTKRLHRESSIRLGDISPDTRPGKTTFSPLAFPNGAILYNMSSAEVPAAHAAMSPLETFRETFLIFGITDANELGSDVSFDDTILTLKEQLDEACRHRSQALVTKLLVFDVPESHIHVRTSSDVVCIPTLEMSRSTTMKTIMCDISAEFLGELSSYAANIQNQQTIDSPAVSVGRVASVPSPSSRSLDLARSDSVTQGSRPATPAQNGDGTTANSSSTNLQHMSLQPAVTNSRPSSPANVFDSLPTMTGDNNGDGSRPFDEESTTRRARPKTIALMRDSSRDRKSQQTTAISSTDRARNRVKARQSIIIGTLHLHAGRWADALRELVDGTTRSRAFSDHLWHAKGLENILVTLLLLAWTGSDFQIPKICYPVSDKSVLPKGISSTAGAAASTESNGRSSAEGQAQALSSLVSDIVHMIVSIHIRAYNFQGEGLPQLPFSECVVRLSHLLAVINVEGGGLTKDAFQAIVFAKSLSAQKDSPRNGNSSAPTKRDVSSLLFRAYPANIQGSEIPLRDIVSIYSGIASVLSVLGLHRKRAMVMKEMLSTLVPSLIQARKVGAAEMGIHPAASLATLHGLTGENSLLDDNKTSGEESAGTFQALFIFLCATYGILSEMDPKQGHAIEDGVRSSATENGVLDEILEGSIQRSFGSLNLKVDVLRLCANFSEALPNFADVMGFNADLLRTAGPGIAPEAGSMDGLVQLAREEQVRLATKLHRTLGVFPTSETTRLETTYWDKFLIRGVILSEPSDERRLIEIRKSELSSFQLDTAKPSNSDRGPFIHNPFLKPKHQDATSPTVTVNEQTTFEILLQNLYDFEVIVEAIELIAEGVEFKQDQHSLVLGPFRIQRAFVTGIAAGSGELKIVGCNVKFQGCLKQAFPIFPDAWSPERELKVKCSGLDATKRHALGNISRSFDRESEYKTQLASKKPAPSTVTVTVEKEQPLLSIIGTSSSQSIVDVLEGETTTFSITVRNDSTSSIIDFLQLAFTDTIETLSDVKERNSVGPRELYERDFAALHRQPLRWIRETEQRDIVIQPGEVKSIHVTVLGRLGLTQASVYISYAHLGGPLNEAKEKIYTRRLSLPLTITVNPSVRLNNFEILPLHKLTSTLHQPHAEQNGGCDNGYISSPQSLNDSSFVLLLDCRNHARHPMEIKTSQMNTISEGLENDSDNHSSHTGDVVQPGHTARLALRVRKLYVDDSSKAIPFLRPDSQRQHVVDVSRTAAEEQALVAAFWYREKLLQGLKAEWREVTSMRQGHLDLRGIGLSPQMIEIIRRDRLAVEMEITQSPDTEGSLRKNGTGIYYAKTDELLVITTTVRNQSNDDIRCLLTIQPKLNADVGGKMIDLTRRVAWTGVLKKHLKVLKPHESVHMQTGLSVLSSGNYEISAAAHPDTLGMQDVAQHLPNATVESSDCLGAATCRLIVDQG